MTPFTHSFLVPDYYPAFACKGGACRHTCCKGWGISVSMEEYFRLLGMECENTVRKRLDCAFHIPHDSSPQRYALINPNWQGDCPLHDEDGLCALQRACGEALLPAICRLYPRSPKRDFAFECSCTNSCEKVLELLLNREEKLTFLPQKLTFPFTPTAADNPRQTRGFYNAIRKFCLSCLQERALPLPERLLTIGLSLQRLNEVKNTGYNRIRQELDALTQQPPRMSTPKEGTEYALSVAGSLLTVFLENSPSLESYGSGLSTALQPENYVRAREGFARRFPHAQTDFEHFLVNHCFYECFPFSDLQEGFLDEFLALCAVYALLRVMVVLAVAQSPTQEAYVDAAASTFRLIEHSPFDRNAAVLLHQADCVRNEQLACLLTL